MTISVRPWLAPEDAAVTIVEFFDYRCSFCILTNDWLQDVILAHGDDVRVVFKEFPIRGAESVESSRAALAVWNTQPDAYLAFHDGLMRAGGPLPTTRIDEIALASGVDIETMRSAMQDESILGLSGRRACGGPECRNHRHPLLHHWR